MRKLPAIAMLLFVLNCLTPEAPAGELPLNVQAGAKVASAYVWRGKVISEDTVIQPEIVAKTGCFTLDLWGTWDVRASEGTPTRTRMDASLDYGGTWRSLAYRLGIVARAYHDDPGGHAADTYECWSELAATDIPGAPSLTLCYDFGSINGFYGSLGLSYARAIREDADVKLALNMGFGSASFNRNFFPFSPPAGETEEPAASVSAGRNALVDLVLSVSTPFYIREHLIVVPKVEYILLLDSDVKAIVEDSGSKAENVVAGLTVAWQF